MRAAVDLDAEDDAAVHRRGQRLRAAHAAEAGGDDQRAREACRRSAARAQAAKVS